MRKLLLLAFLLLFVPARGHAQYVVVGQGCGASGLNAIANDGTPVVCRGNPLVWTAVGGGSSSISSPSRQTANPLAFGAKWDVRFEGDCTFTNLSQTVTCPTASFTSADIGKIEFGTAGTTQVNSSMLTAGGLVVPQGTITGVTNGTTVTVSLAATAGCTTSNTVSCTFAWGTQDDTTAILNASTAAWNTIGGGCALEFPAGAAFFSSAILDGTVRNGCMGSTTNGTLSDLTSWGPMVFGQGGAQSVLIPLPSFNFASCTFGSASNTCIGGIGNLQAHDFGINGLQQIVGGTHAVVLFESTGVTTGGGCDGGASVWNMAFSGWGLTAANSVGFKAGIQECNDPYFANINVSAFGQTPCNFFPDNIMNLYSVFCFGGQNRVVTVGNGSATAPTIHQLNTFGSQFSSSLATGGQVIDVTGSAPIAWNSNGDQILNANVTGTNQFALIRTDSTSVINFNNDQLLLPSTTGATTLLLFANNSSSSIHFRGTVANAAGTNNAFMNIGATDKVFDDGGNTFTNGTVANTINGKIFGSRSATGTALVAGNLVPSANWGTGAGITVPLGDSQNFSFTLTNGSAAVGANPTIAFTFPTAFPFIAPICTVWQVGGTQAITALTGVLAPSAASTTGVTLTYNGTPTINLTEFYQGSCH